MPDDGYLTCVVGLDIAVKRVNPKETNLQGPTEKASLRIAVEADIIEPSFKVGTLTAALEIPPQGACPTTTKYRAPNWKALAQ